MKAATDQPPFSRSDFFFFLLPFLGLFRSFLIYKKHYPEQNPGKSKRTARSRIKHGDEHLGSESRRAEPYTASHNYRHDDIGFQIKLAEEDSDAERTCGTPLATSIAAVRTTPML